MLLLPGSRVYGRLRQLYSCGVYAYESPLCYMRSPDIMTSLDGLEPHVPSLSISCYQYVKSYCYYPLCRFATPMPMLRSASFHLCRLSLFRYYLAHHYSKKTVGGLSWDTTDGTFISSTLPPFVNVNQHLLIFLMNVRWRVMFFLFPV